MEQKVDELRQLALDMNIRDARKLYQMAQSREVRDITMKMATEALKDSVQRQVLGNPGAGYNGHFASTGPGRDLQEDLIDWGANNQKAKKGGGQYALVGADVYTRKLAVQPLKNKRAATVEAAAHPLLEKLEGPGLYVAHIRTDKGK